MLKNLRLRARFTVILLIVFAISLPIMTFSSYYILKANAIREILEEANIFLVTMESARAYVGKTLRPKLFKELPGRFIVEGMSSTFVATNIANRMNEKLPNYYFKEATLNPLNPKNKVDAFEEEMVKKFRDGTLEKEWRGFKSTPDGEFYVIMRPVVVNDFDCLRCHSNPDIAPPEQREKYGTTNGYGWKMNEIVAVNTIIVPAEVPIKNAKKALILFTSLYGGFFLFLLIIINRVIKGSIISPIERFVIAAEEISRGRMDKEFDVKSNDEVRTLADAFTRLKLSLAKAMDILKKK
ncbi:MAG: DUF3365 domain-containing protein [Nitrospirae bacterium]|nr:DUF3365 domain-containing protein [Nitrospirota bacterium]